MIHRPAVLAQNLLPNFDASGNARIAIGEPLLAGEEYEQRGSLAE